MTQRCTGLPGKGGGGPAAERAVPIVLAEGQACPGFYKGNVTARNGSRVAPCEAILLFLLCFRTGVELVCKPGQDLREQRNQLID